MGIKPGDEVTVKWSDGELMDGELIEQDGRIITIRTGRGGTMSGMGTITEKQEKKNDRQADQMVQPVDGLVS